MKIYFILGVLLACQLFATTGFGQENDWENPAVTGINKEPQHATHLALFDNKSLSSIKKDNKKKKWPPCKGNTL